MRSYIEVENVSKRFGKKPILENISLSVEQGQTIGLVGANGSGKSVLFKIMMKNQQMVESRNRESMNARYLNP